MKQDYPDISGILAAKVRRRRALAALSWEEKVAIVDQMRKSMPKGIWKDPLADSDALAPSQTDHPHR